jgi:hypothetical protein
MITDIPNRAQQRHYNKTQTQTQHISKSGLVFVTTMSTTPSLSGAKRKSRFEDDTTTPTATGQPDPVFSAADISAAAAVKAAEISRTLAAKVCNCLLFVVWAGGFAYCHTLFYTFSPLYSLT